MLLVEGASIDKQLHRNHAAGTIGDAIELDQAVGVAREWFSKCSDTLLLATADHDQTSPSWAWPTSAMPICKAANPSTKWRWKARLAPRAGQR